MRFKLCARKHLNCTLKKKKKGGGFGRRTKLPAFSSIRQAKNFADNDSTVRVR